MRRYLLFYLIVGALNTLVGFGIIFTLMYLGNDPTISNLIGYICGIMFSYFMNKSLTFKSKNKSKLEFIRFIVAMLISYLLNLTTLKLALNSSVDPYISQIIAGFIYTMSGFLISRFWVFKIK